MDNLKLIRLKDCLSQSVLDKCKEIWLENYIDNDNNKDAYEKGYGVLTSKDYYPKHDTLNDCLILFRDTEVIGWVNVNTKIPDYEFPTTLYENVILTNNDFIFIQQVAIARKEQGKGYGSLLYNLLFEVVPNLKIFAYVRDINKQSFEFHKKMGFKEIGKFEPSYEINGIKQFKSTLFWRMA